MSSLKALQQQEFWEEFYRYKTEGKKLPKAKERELYDFIDCKEYLAIAGRMQEPDFVFSISEKKSVNKSGTGKKRVIYTYSRAENLVLKGLCYLLYRYDDKISPACYSFRKNSSAREAIYQILDIEGLGKKYCLKVDIQNYFNSIPAPLLVEVLQEFLEDDKPLLDFLSRLLLDKRAIENGQVIRENRGAAAGTPISPFLANIYLKSLDDLFVEKGVPYFRYSDDILLFADTRQQAEEYLQLLEEHITRKGLTLNRDKVALTGPGEGWSFLGFAYDGQHVDLSQITKDKLKAKIRRKAHGLYRWSKRKDITFEHTAKAMIRIFNRKFYDEQEENQFTWSRWFFPVLTTDRSLKELDAYFLMYIRYLYSGRHYKGNYRVSYEEIKALGYRSLVHEYYVWKKREK